jgi:hypothetical protein
MEPLEISSKEEDCIHNTNTNPDHHNNDDNEDEMDASLSSLFPPSQLLKDKRKHQDDDLDEMLNLPLSNRKNLMIDVTPTTHKEQRCSGPTKIGNTIVLNPFIYHKTKKCIVGPHWFGLLFTSSLLGLASYHFLSKAKYIGTITYITCITLTVLAFTTLLMVGLSDPGIVMSIQHNNSHSSDASSKGQYQNLLVEQQQEEGAEQWRYCITCNIYQPPKAAHCTDCNVCIDGYDHHCPWMGSCIGKNNFKPFVVFNMTWLIYLLYASIWVSVIGPSTIVQS